MSVFEVTEGAWRDEPSIFQGRATRVSGSRVALQKEPPRGGIGGRQTPTAQEETLRELGVKFVRLFFIRRFNQRHKAIDQPGLLFEAL